MRNGAFVAWMIGYPLVVAIDRWLDRTAPHYVKADGGVEAIIALVVLMIWAGVGLALYEPAVSEAQPRQSE